MKVSARNSQSHQGNIEKKPIQGAAYDTDQQLNQTALFEDITCTGHPVKHDKDIKCHSCIHNYNLDGETIEIYVTIRIQCRKT